jgi:hypothetical protein
MRDPKPTASDRNQIIRHAPLAQGYIEGMTSLMSQVVQRLESLPQAQQEAVASLLLEELDGESRWDDALVGSQDILGQLAQQALSVHEKGQTVPGGFDSDA